MLDGVENMGAARSDLAIGGEGWPDPLEEGCEAGGDDCGGVPKVAVGVSFSKNVSRSVPVVREYRRSIDSSRTSRETCDGRLP